MSCSSTLFVSRLLSRRPFSGREVGVKAHITRFPFSSSELAPFEAQVAVCSGVHVRLLKKPNINETNSTYIYVICAYANTKYSYASFRTLYANAGRGGETRKAKAVRKEINKTLERKKRERERKKKFYL